MKRSSILRSDHQPSQSFGKRNPAPSANRRPDTAVTLIIITKDRPTNLVRCYESLKNLTEYPDEFILIDSSTDEKSKQLTRQLSKSVPFSVRYIYESRLGFPVARNRGIKAAICTWAAFTDDDCIVDPNFIKALRRKIRAHPNAAAIAGQSNSCYPKNLLSHVATFNENHWKARVRKGDHIEDLETLDNKNVAYNMTFLKKNNISYDSNRIHFDGASDDCDLGMQIQLSRGSAYYAKNMIVYHKDLTTLLAYTRRIQRRSSAHATYESKWRSYRENNNLGNIKRVRFLQFFSQYSQTNKLSVFDQVNLLVLLVYTSLLVRIMKSL